MNVQKVELMHRTVGDVELRLGLGSLQEEGGFIGSSASGAFGSATATDTQFVNLSLMAPVTDDVSLFGAYNLGRSSTSTAGGSLLNDLSSTETEAFGAGLVVKDLVLDDDRFTLLVGQPLRVTAGSADVTVPVSRTEEGEVFTETVRADLSPDEREIATEAVYKMSLGAEGGVLSTGAFVRFRFMIPIRYALPTVPLLLLALIFDSARGDDEQTTSSAPPPAQQETTASVEEIAKAARDSVVVVSYLGREGRREGLGAGFVVAADGLIATNLHVIGEARPISVQLATAAALTSARSTPRIGRSI